MSKPKVRASRPSTQALGLRRLRGDDSGNAMVIAIAAVLMIGLLMGVIFSSVMFSVGSVSKNRAHAAARAAAEGGAQQVARKLLQQVDGPQACANLEPAAGAWVNYTVEGVWFKAKEGDTAWTRCDSGGPAIPKLAHAVKVKTTGFSTSAGTEGGDRGSVGQQGNTRGDQATIEMIFERPATLGLNHAVFGDDSVYANSNLVTQPDASNPFPPAQPTPADGVTNGKWTCPDMGRISGSVFAMGGVAIPGNCEINGNLYVKGLLDVRSTLKVTGEVRVLGDFSNNTAVQVKGDLLISGNMDLRATGNSFEGDVRVKGEFLSSSSVANDFKKHLYTGKPLNTGWGAKDTAEKMGSRFHANAITTGAPWEYPSIFDTAENPRTAEDDEFLAFPMLRSTQAPFDTFETRTWQQMTGQNCPSNAGASFTVDRPTAIDLRGCDGLSMGPLNIKLNADLAIFTKNVTKTGPWTFTTVDPSSPQRHTLYLVALPEDSQTQCQSGKGGKITFNDSGWSQGSTDPSKIRTKVVLYAADELYMSSKPTGPFNGQMYGCKVNTPSGVDLFFARGGDDFTDTLWDLGIGAVRDITDEPRP